MGCRYSSQRTPWWGGYGGCRQDDLASTYVVKLRPRAVFANEQFLRPVAYLQRELTVTVESIVSMVSMVVHMVLLDSTIP